MIRRWWWSLTRPMQPMTETRIDPFTFCYEKGSLVVAVSDRADSDMGEFLWKMLKRWGYRELRRDPMMRATVYVRPWPLWAAHKAALAVRGGYYRVLEWLYERGAISLTTDEAEVVHWYNVRPWRMGKSHRSRG